LTEEEQRQAVKVEAERLAVDALYSEKGHFAASSRWRRSHLWLGVPAATLAASAGAAFISDWFPVWVPALCAFVAAAITSVSTFLKPDDISKQHHNSGVDYGALRRQVRIFANVKTNLQSISPDKLQEELEGITASINSIQKGSRAIPRFAFRIAASEIERGTADYAKSEVEAAIGKADET